MGRQVNEAKITTRNARSRLPARKAPHWRAIDRGAHIGYRKGANGGTWVARHKRDGGGYATKALGAADDALEANGADVLSYSQALEKVRQWCEERGQPVEPNSYTVADAIADYLAWYKQHRKGLYEVTRRANADIVTELGAIAVDALDSKTIREWHEMQAARAPRLRSGKSGPRRTREVPTDPEGMRKRKTTANKGLTILKAALNHVFAAGHAKSDDAWRRVKPFRNVDAARLRYLSVEEATRLINACDPDMRRLVRAALYTGARYGELRAVEVVDFNADSGTLHVRFTKNDRPRHVALTEEAQAFFKRLTLGQAGGERMLVREDGKPWGKSHQIRRLVDACKAAKIDPPVSFHILRHSYGSWLAMRGVPLQVIADALGHADTRITQRHYAALAPNYVADTVRANLPSFGINENDNVEKLKP